MCRCVATCQSIGRHPTSSSSSTTCRSKRCASSICTHAGAPQIDLTAPLQGGDKLRFPHVLAVGAPKPLRRLLVTAEYFRTCAEVNDTRYPRTHSLWAHACRRRRRRGRDHHPQGRGHRHAHLRAAAPGQLHAPPPARRAFCLLLSLLFRYFLGPRLELTIVSCAQVDVLLDLLRTHEPGEITILTIGIMKPLEA